MRLTRFAAFIGALFLPAAAMAQGVCPMGQPGPQIIAASTYALTVDSECSFLIFTNPQGVAVTAPAVSSLPSHWNVSMMSTLGSLNLTVASGSINRQTATSQSTGPFTPVTLFEDNSGTNFWLTLAGNQSQVSSLLAATSGLVAGTTLESSPVVVAPNGVMRFNNAASFQKGSSPPWLGSTVCQGAPFGGQQPGSAWLMVLDSFGLRRYIPTC